MRLHTRDCLQLADVISTEKFDLRALDGTFLAHFDRQIGNSPFPRIINSSNADMALVRTAYVSMRGQTWHAEFDDVGLSKIVEIGPTTSVSVWFRPECKPIAGGVWEHPVSRGSRVNMVHQTPAGLRDYVISSITPDDPARIKFYHVLHAQSMRWGFVTFFQSEAWQQLRDEYRSVVRVHTNKVRFESDEDRVMFKLRTS